MWVQEEHQGPTFVKEPPDTLDFSNMTGATLECTATGRPEPKVTWTRVDETLVTDVSRLRQVLINGTLVFKPFKAEDYRQDVHTAIYKCVASNPTGSVVSRDTQECYKALNT
uniref:Ig-like domain-containing protein n=1 Tax=Strigamia maritima TaxID=126957 RepID=T1JJ06_STRMM